MSQVQTANCVNTHGVFTGPLLSSRLLTDATTSCCLEFYESPQAWAEPYILTTDHLLNPVELGFSNLHSGVFQRLKRCHS